MVVVAPRTTASRGALATSGRTVGASSRESTDFGGPTAYDEFAAEIRSKAPAKDKRNALKQLKAGYEHGCSLPGADAPQGFDSPFAS